VQDNELVEVVHVRARDKVELRLTVVVNKVSLVASLFCVTAA
jgi:hypothetical protein